MITLVRTVAMSKRSILDFPLSRRESVVNHSENEEAEDAEKVTGKRTGNQQLNWMNSLKKTHEKFTFTPIEEVQVKTSSGGGGVVKE